MPWYPHNHDSRYVRLASQLWNHIVDRVDEIVTRGEMDVLYAEKTPTEVHIASTSNPHTVTKTQVGLGSVDNTSDANKPVSTAQQDALDLKANTTALADHVGDTSNPHDVTKTQVGLGSVDNTSDVDKPVSTAQQAALDLKAGASDLSTHTGNTENPHGVTAAQAEALPHLSGDTASRPAASSVAVGTVYFDTDLDTPLWSDGSAWHIGYILNAPAAALTAPVVGAIDATYDAFEQSVIDNLRTRQNEIESRLQSLGLLSP